jgi:CubicO group peptidase (beta-lactamase class C family)
MSTSAQELLISGTCKPGFEGVREEFEENFRSRREIGASVCVQVRGETLVDLWGGIAEQQTGKAWDRDTVSVVFCTTKSAAAACVHLLSGRGSLDIGAPVAAYWPEFGCNGKEEVTVFDVLAHRSGVSAIRAPVAEGLSFDAVAIAELIAAEAPFFPPGSRHGYAGMTFAYILDALIRRTDGRSLGRYFAEELAGPLGLDFWIGAPPQVESRIAPMLLPEIDLFRGARMLLAADPESVPGLFFGNTGGYMSTGPRNFDSAEAHAAEVPAGGAITNARGLAGLHAPLADPDVDHNGVRFDSGAVARLSTAHSAGFDHGLGINSRWGLGFALACDNRWRAQPQQRLSLLIGAAAFANSGLGGSMGMADPERGLSFGYTCNRMAVSPTVSIRGQALLDATYRALGATSSASGAWR